MSQDLDAILNSISSAASTCYDLNGNGNLTSNEQNIFYKFAEDIIFRLTQIHPSYDAIVAGLANDPTSKVELDQLWLDANTALNACSANATNQTLSGAESATSHAIGRTTSIVSAY